MQPGACVAGLLLQSPPPPVSRDACPEDWKEDSESSESPLDEESQHGAQSDRPQGHAQQSDAGDALAGAESNGKKVKTQKSAEAKERDERLATNQAKYAQLSTEEIEKVVPRLPGGGLTSVGAFLHDEGLCSVCIFHHREKGCYNGVRCKFCHGDHPPPERKRRRRLGTCPEEAPQGPAGGSAEAQPKSGRAAPRRKRRRKAKLANAGQASGQASEDDDRAPDGKARRMEYGSAWVGDGAGGEELVLNEQGNSRPCWLRDAAAEPFWPYGPPPPQVPGQPAWQHSALLQPQHHGLEPPHWHCGAPPPPPPQYCPDPAHQAHAYGPPPRWPSAAPPPAQAPPALEWHGLPPHGPGGW